MKKIDFSYRFAAPWRITLSQPSGSVKTLCDIASDKIRVMWTYSDLKNLRAGVWQPQRPEWKTDITLNIGSGAAAFDDARRMPGGVPGFIVSGNRTGIDYTLSGVQTDGADVFRFSATSSAAEKTQLQLCSTLYGGWVMANPAWIDGKDSDSLLCMQFERGDRILMFGTGAQNYPVRLPEGARGTLDVPLPGAVDSAPNPSKTVTMQYDILPGQTVSGIFVRPHRAFRADLPALRETDWAAKADASEKAWRDYLTAHARFTIPDSGMSEAYLACLADLFVMREEFADGYMGICCGTDFYRSTNPCEPSMAGMLFDDLGYIAEAEENCRLNIDAQGDNGDWNDPFGWSAFGWSSTGFKALMLKRHYQITKDKKFLLYAYEHLKKAVLWQADMRATTQNAANEADRGLMPRGMGDCGMMNDGDYFGVFYPHNCYAVAADGVALWAARELGYTDDGKLFEKLYEQSSSALVRSLRLGAITEPDGSKRIPSVAGKTGGSCYGSLAAFYPCGLLDGNDPLIQGSIEFTEKHISEGGIPLGLGWMQTGLWVAIALDNISAAHLRRGEYDEAERYLYPTVNHASPLVTWCEERMPEPEAEKISGDRQHLWTPLAVCRYIRDAFAFEHNGEILLCAGLPREWLADGNETGFEDIRTVSGVFSLAVKRDGKTVSYTVSGQATSATALRLVIRYPEGEREIALTASAGAVSLGGSIEI